MGTMLLVRLLISPPAPPPRVAAYDQLETYREVWTSWLRKNDLPLGDFEDFFEATHAPFRERKTYAEAPQLYARMQRWIPVAQYHDFFLYFLVKADLLFIGEKVDFSPGEPRPLFTFGCPRVRYTYRIREILFSTGRIPVQTGDTLDVYGTSLWTGYYEAYADSIDRAAMEASRARGDSIPPPPPSGTVPISLGCWTDLYTPSLSPCEKCAGLPVSSRRHTTGGEGSDLKPQRNPHHSARGLHPFQNAPLIPPFPKIGQHMPVQDLTGLCVVCMAIAGPQFNAHPAISHGHQEKHPPLPWPHASRRIPKGAMPDAPAVIEGRRIGFDGPAPGSIGRKGGNRHHNDGYGGLVQQQQVKATRLHPPRTAGDRAGAERSPPRPPPPPAPARTPPA